MLLSGERAEESAARESGGRLEPRKGSGVVRLVMGNRFGLRGSVQCLGDEVAFWLTQQLGVDTTQSSKSGKTCTLGLPFM